MFKDFNFTSYKFLSLSILFFGLASYIHFFEPLDLALTAGYNKIRTHDASGEVVIVSLDDYAAKQGFSTPIPEKYAGEFLSTLLDAGARSIVLAEPVLAQPEGSTGELQDLLTANAASVFIVQPITNDANRNAIKLNNYVTSEIPVHNNKTTTYWGGIDSVKYTETINGQRVIAAEAALAEISDYPEDEFAIDYGIYYRSVPFVSYDPENYSNLIASVSGKRVVVGLEATQNAIQVRILGYKGYYGLSTIIALGAETLMQGRPRHLAWPWLFCFACISAWYIVGSRSAWWQSFVFVTSILIILCLRFILNNSGISLNVFGGICLILYVTPFAISRSLRERSARESTTHPDSGLPSLSALRLIPQTGRPLVVASIAGFDELIGLLTPVERKTLAVRIASLATSESDTWHGEDGHFYWFIRPEQAESLSDHLESLGLILRNGFSIGTFPISLQTVFGVDLRYEASMSDRILGANLSAKRAEVMGKTWLTYEEGDKTEAAWSITRLRELDLAIRAGQVRADLQPKIDLRTGQIAGVEALARWTHPIRGPIRPDEFVAAAESGGRIKELTIAVMHSALASVQSTMFDDPEFTVSVNITPSLLTDITFPHTISALLAEYQISPAQLILEITESTAFSNSETCLKSMHELVAMGITLSIDDYGTGNSTLDYLRKIPARELKIDRKFVSDILKSDADSLLVKSTIKLAHELNMLVVAEGVEDSLTLEKLRGMGCDLVQGFLISRPLSPEKFVYFTSNLRGPAKRVNEKI